MLIPLKTNLTRELTTHPGLIITMTPNGISFRVKRKHNVKYVSWEQIIGVAGLCDSNLDVIEKSKDLVLKQIGYIR